MPNNSSDSAATNGKRSPATKTFRAKLLGWRGSLVLLLLIGITFFFFTRARGQSEWEHYQKQLAAKGEHLDWAYFIPPAVADLENFYAAPEMRAMFKRISKWPGITPASAPSTYSWSLPNSRNWDELKGKEPFVDSPNGTSYPVSVVFKWEEENAALLKLFNDACQRPKARLDDYRNPFDCDIPNFVNMRGAGQALATLAKAHIVSNQPEKAVHDRAGIQRLIDVLENGPTLVEAMIRTALIGLYVDIVHFGIEKKMWDDEQLRTLSASFAKDRCLPYVAHAMRAETAGIIKTVDILPAYRLLSSTQIRFAFDWKVLKEDAEAMSLGMRFQFNREKNLLTYTRCMQDGLDSLDTNTERFYPRKAATCYARLSSMTSSSTNLLACMGIPNFTKAFETAAKNETLAEEAMLACELERFHRANGHYPETLQELVPQYISKVPNDVISGDALKYRRTSPDKFLLYGVGSNEADDGGVVGPDWVWRQK